MRTLRSLLVVLIVVAGAVGVICALNYLPLGVTILPGWLASVLPELGTPAVGWLITTDVAMLVLAALAVAGTHRAGGRQVGPRTPQAEVSSP